MQRKVEWKEVGRRCGVEGGGKEAWIERRCGVEGGGQEAWIERRCGVEGGGQEVWNGTRWAGGVD